MPASAPLDEWDAARIDGPDGLRALAADCRPFVVRGLARSWPVTRAGADDPLGALAYLAGFASGGGQAEYFSAAAALGGRYHYGEGPGGFNFARHVMPVTDAIARIMENAGAGAEIGYLGSLPAESHFPGFAGDNGTDIVPASVRPRVWLGNQSVVACHYDVFDNLACVVAGQRRFTLYPPDAIGDLYIGPIDHTLSGQPISLAAGRDGAGADYPRFAAARDRAIRVDLMAGDALYLPKLWWHQVEGLSPVNMLVNYWWDGFSAGPDSPHTTMMLAMIAIAERPPAERAAWRAFFDHYVFRPDGHPLAHMPAERRGILGPLAEGNYGRIRAIVMRLLRGG